MRTVRRRFRTDSGLISLEAAIVLAVLLVGCASIGIITFQSIEAAAAARRVAQSSARSATLEQTPAGAIIAAERAMAAASNETSATCQIIDAQIGEMTPGETVTITVECTAPNSGFGAWVTGGRTFDASATEVIDQYRSRET